LTKNIYPFSKYHPNVGPRLRAEISLLSPSLTNNSSGGDLVFDTMINVSCAIDHSEKLQLEQPSIAENTDARTCTNLEADRVSNAHVLAGRESALEHRPFLGDPATHDI
jgi:hypothetical protein